jgi:hypothetical protein
VANKQIKQEKFEREWSERVCQEMYFSIAFSALRTLVAGTKRFMGR